MDDFSESQHVAFIDHQGMQWDQVRRVRCLFYQRFQYEYPGPIHDLKQRLMVFPTDHYGAQYLRRHALKVQPAPVMTRQSADRFGNRVLELEVPQVERAVSFDVLMIVENDTHNANSPTPTLMLTREGIDHYLQPTRLTTPNARIEAVARQLHEAASTPHDLAQRIHDWVYEVMHYQSGVTTVETTAAEALAIGQGMCQDYSHLMLAMCRAAGLPARYVSGHLLGEGGSHAWVEVLLPTMHGFNAVAFDPTNARRPHLGYVTVAVGRDYRDISPTTGRFTAPYGGQLTCSKRAGLTLVEYLNGDILQS